MSETKYRSVIHVSTNQIVTAFKFENDATWVGRSREELISTPTYCDPSQKVRMIFVQSYTKNNRKSVLAYFRKKKGEPSLSHNISGESNDHKNAKENIYEGVYSGNITIDGSMLNISKIKDIFMEYRIGVDGYVIPDVIILFKESHPKYGLGIFFEIQFSNQPSHTTDKRSYHRVIEGFSGAWLCKSDFNKSMEFIHSNINIKSHKSLLIELEELKENDFIRKINKYGEIIDNKLLGIDKIFLDKLHKLDNISLKIYNNYSERLSAGSLELSNNISKNKIDMEDISRDLNKSYGLWKTLDSSQATMNMKESLNDMIDIEINKCATKMIDMKVSVLSEISEKSDNIKQQLKNIDITPIVDSLILDIGKDLRDNKNRIMGEVWKR